MRRPPTASGIDSDASDRITVVNSDSDLDRLPSSKSLRGLDWLNFLLADVQTGVGPFLAIYLAAYGWNEQRVGLALPSFWPVVTAQVLIGVMSSFFMPPSPLSHSESLGTNSSTCARDETRHSTRPATSLPL
jgi:hypothetical protein